MSLSGKRVVVLGGTSGIGFAVAEAAAREGAEVVVASRRQERVDRAIASLPGKVEGYAVNLSDADEIRALFERIGALDHLVYTAGETLRLGPLGALSLEDARRAFDVRFWGAFAAAKYASGNIRPGGSIVLTTGVARDRPRKGWTVTASICGATDALTRALAVELAPIRVNTVAPGTIATALWDDMSDEDRETMYRNAAGRLLVGRVGEPRDVAEAYLYLMRGGFSTGQVVIVDGGAVLV